MANPEHVAILKQGVEVWNEWRRKNPDIEPDLSDYKISFPALAGINLSDVDCRNMVLLDVDLTSANLEGAELINVIFDNVSLDDAKLNGTYLLKCLFKSSFLLNTQFVHSSIYDTLFLDSEMQQANFSNATLGSCVFSNSIISEARFDNTSYRSRCSVGFDTIFLSQSKIPRSFLRGCGVPEELINIIPSIIDHPFQYYSCFISYSSSDNDFARRLHNDLQGKGVRCWFAAEDMKIGDRIRSRIDQSIRLHDKLLLILSEKSIASQWVEKEVETAFEKERRNPGKTVLFPIRVDDAVMDSDEAWAADIRRTRHIGDFSNWKDHDSYKKAFDRLMRDLKASEE